jgi:RHS repeat-associated protein
MEAREWEVGPMRSSCFDSAPTGGPVISVSRSDSRSARASSQRSSVGHRLGRSWLTRPRYEPGPGAASRFRTSGRAASGAATGRAGWLSKTEFFHHRVPAAVARRRRGGRRHAVLLALRKRSADRAFARAHHPAHRPELGRTRPRRQSPGHLTTGFLYQDGLNVVAQLDGSGNLVARYVFGTKPNVPDYYTTSAGTFRILSDHLGSPRLVVNTSSGAVVEEIDYDEFGVMTNDTAPGTTPFGFAGGLYDKDTGLVRFGARDYDASVGRWSSKDPMLFYSGLNTFAYVLNDPINFLDRKGLAGWPTAIVGAIVGGIGSAAVTYVGGGSPGSIDAAGGAGAVAGFVGGWFDPTGGAAVGFGAAAGAYGAVLTGGGPGSVAAGAVAGAITGGVGSLAPGAAGITVGGGLTAGFGLAAAVLGPYFDSFVPQTPSGPDPNNGDPDPNNGEPVCK